MSHPTGANTSTVDQLRTEGDELDALVAALDAAAWRHPTPAPGWTIAHQIGHLAWSDEVATLAITSPTDFGPLVEPTVADGSTVVDDAAAEFAALPPDRLLARWRAGRVALADRLASADPKAQIGWFGPPMSPRSMATAG